MNTLDALTMDFEPGEIYWLHFSDGSRIKVEATIDSRGDVDLRNDTIDFLLWTGRKGWPANRDHIARVEEDIVQVGKHVNADPEFNGGLDKLAALVERDCE